MQLDVLHGSLTAFVGCGDGGGDGASLHARYQGGGANGYARGVWDVDWEQGATIRFAASFYLPPGFARSLQGQVDLLRWDAWPDLPAWTGVGIWSSDDRARLLEMGANRPPVELGQPFALPEGRWVRIEVHQRLERRLTTTNLVFVDGRLVSSSPHQNLRASRVARLRAGLVAVEAGRQTRPLALNFDAVRFDVVKPSPPLLGPTLLSDVAEPFLAASRPSLQLPSGSSTPC